MKYILSKSTIWILANLFYLILVIDESKGQICNSKWGIISQNMPHPREENSCFNYENKIYFVGGRGTLPVVKYDTNNNKWDILQKSPIEIHHFQAVSHNNIIYIVCGQTGGFPHEKPLENIWKYNPKLDKWEKGDNIPKERQRGSAGCVVYKDEIYVVGGIKDGHWDGHVNWFDKYNPSTGEWTILPNAPRARDHFEAVVVKNKLYCIGGRRSNGKNNNVFGDLEIYVDAYDFKEDKWSSAITQIPTPRAGSACVVLNNRIYVIGGESTQLKAHNECEVYNPEKNTWNILSNLNIPRHGTSAGLVDKSIYIGAGASNMGGSPLESNIEKLDLKTLNRSSNKVLYITGHTDKYHNWREAIKFYIPLLSNSDRFDLELAIVNSKTVSKIDFSKYNSIILNINQMYWDKNTKQKFEEYMFKGGGLVVIHETNNAFPEWKGFNEMIGLGGWGERNKEAGPYYYWENGRMRKDYKTKGPAGSHGEKVPFRINVRDKSHPIVKGLPSQWIHNDDELYGNLRGPVQNIKVIATAYSDPKTGGTGKEEPVLMTIRYGKGRIFHSVLGHTHNGYNKPLYNKHLDQVILNGLLWTMKMNE